jgi:hypothetical protein
MTRRSSKPDVGGIGAEQAAQVILDEEKPLALLPFAMTVV